MAFIISIAILFSCSFSTTPFVIITTPNFLLGSKNIALRKPYALPECPKNISLSTKSVAIRIPKPVNFQKTT